MSFVEAPPDPHNQNGEHQSKHFSRACDEHFAFRMSLKVSLSRADASSPRLRRRAFADFARKLPKIRRRQSVRC
jgi:hypothetical protein